jgi:hypothetical protein
MLFIKCYINITILESCRKISYFIIQNKIFITEVDLLKHSHLFLQILLTVMRVVQIIKMLKNYFNSGQEIEFQVQKITRHLRVDKVHPFVGYADCTIKMLIN